MHPRGIVVWSDCADENVKARYFAELVRRFVCPVDRRGLTGNRKGEHRDLEGAGQIVDTIMTFDEEPAIVIGNVAPRNGTAGTNGSSFAYFWYGETLVLTTIDGFMLSLVRKLDLVSTVSVLHIPTVLAAMEKERVITPRETAAIMQSQFRSLRFVPRAAEWLCKWKELPHTDVPIVAFPEAPPWAIWWRDNFGNCKTTMQWKETQWKEGVMISTGLTKEPIPFIPHLSDVPEGQLAFTAGSSPDERNDSMRFHELVAGDGSAAERCGLDVGETIIIHAAVPAMESFTLQSPNEGRE